MKQCSKQLIIYRITFLIILVLAYLPFLQKGLFSCWDDTYHLYRIYSIADAMKNGIFLLKFILLNVTDMDMEPDYSTLTFSFIFQLCWLCVGCL